MFKVDDTVMYGNAGACKIIDICTKTFNQEERRYYVLNPVYENKTTIYCPVDCDKIKIRKLLSEDEVYHLIKSMPKFETSWIENDQMRKETQYAVLKKGDHQELIQLLRSLYFKREEKQNDGKKFHAADERTMVEAEKLLHQEFALALDIEPEDVVPFVTGKLELSRRKKPC